MIKTTSGKRQQPVVKDKSRICVVCKLQYEAVAPLQKTCSYNCRIKHYKENFQRFKSKNPDIMKVYNKNRILKNPNYWREKSFKERLEIFNALGGKCCVRGCKTTNIFHFHFDYIPTMEGTGYRHPRHKKWVMDNIKDFRLICANHHYELTITGKIKGTKITQKTRNKYASTITI